ncbi:crotonyl-CoA carboxylase/reductase [Nocardia sp. NBC_01503]|uniref:crotonyl-CoA carboxylase/reductase n=1 Tax=Nocardia sp. NBC_01503 TaxID=2975997 RepID=UPI002E7C4719|nr:crotonyl-CoA carboxylase/reductase [Nocardia sp. NBC_01503]WTL32791.1 crotonyl-CoA carboxylase/reductase [Nocardia sp. NBC_01503]
MKKSLYELGEMPPTGHVPEKMYASVIRPDRYGPPEEAFRTEVIDVPPVGRGQVLVYMMAAGVNYNNVWAALGTPVDVIAARQRNGAAEEFHIGGSEGSGIVWAVGDGVKQVRVGDEVILSGCQWDESAADIRAGGDPMMSSTQAVWGYEENFGAFAQFTLVDEYQCHPKPQRLSWAEAAAFLLTGATAYRQLLGWQPNTVRPGDPILIWGGAGGLGSMAIQIVRTFGGRPVAVVSSAARADYCKQLGAEGVLDRSEFTHWGRLPDISDVHASAVWLQETRRFGAAFWEALGEKRAPKIVLEHTGQDSIPTSMYLCDTGGMVVICGGTTGYHADIDLRYLWMRQKRLQGSHFANFQQCRAITELVAKNYIDPCLSYVGEFSEIGRTHQMMRDNAHQPGNMAVLINATSSEA